MTPESWADGTNRWDGYLTAAEFPRIADPKDGRIRIEAERQPLDLTHGHAIDRAQARDDRRVAAPG